MEVESGDNETVGDNETECYSLARAPLAALVVHTIVLSTIAAFSLAGNVLVLVLVAKFKELRIRATLVSLCMVVADLLFTLCYTFPAIVTTVQRRWVFGDDGCKGIGFLALDLQITRWLVVCLLCLDRFASVRFPFSYNRRGKWPMIFLASLAWGVPVLVSAIPIRTFSTFQLRESQPTCLPTCQDELGGLCRAYYAVVLTITFILGSIIPLIMYSWLYHKARKLRHSVKHKMGYLTVQIASGAIIMQPFGEEQEMKKENRATITFMLIFLTVVVTGATGFLLQLLRAVSLDLHCRIPIYIHFLVIEFFLCAPMLTPLVITRDRVFRSCIAKLFCCRKKTGDLQVHHEELSSSPREPMHFERRSSDITTSHSTQDIRTSILTTRPPKNEETMHSKTSAMSAEVCESISLPSQSSS